MPEPSNGIGDDGVSVAAGLLLDAEDEAAVVADLIALLHWAGLGIRSDGAGALVRGAMIAQQHVETLRRLLGEARGRLSGQGRLDDPVGAAP